MTIQMQTGIAANGSVQLPWPSGVVHRLINGVASVDPADVRTALAFGWTVMAGQRWPQAETVRMFPPLHDPIAAIADFHLSDQAAATLGPSGVAHVPIARVQDAKALGWSHASPEKMLENVSNAEPSAIHTWPGGNGIFHVGLGKDGNFNGASVGLFHLANGLNWLRVCPKESARITSPGWFGFSLPAESRIQVQIVDGVPTSLYASVTAGNYGRDA